MDGPGPDEVSPTTRGCLSLIVVIGGVFFFVAAAALWNDTEPLIRFFLILLGVTAVASGAYGLYLVDHDPER
jgi:uncharacterized membrane protein YidH (DUF202 family)